MDKQLVLVIGGPGKSGSSTIAKMLADYFGVKRVYGGRFFREEAKKKGFQSYNDFLEKMPRKEIEAMDRFFDYKLRDYAKRGSVVIESKTFAGIATKEDISCSSKIWLDARLDVRVQRAIDKEGIKSPITRYIRESKMKRDLVLRYRIDGERYKKLYDKDYDHPEKYNNLVIDNSNQTPGETFNLIINFLKDAGVTK